MFDEICDFVQLIYENPPDIFFQKFVTVPQEPLVYPLGNFNDLRLLTAHLDHIYKKKSVQIAGNPYIWPHLFISDDVSFIKTL